jgi:DUF4097 and DUF4098 domain-containing protein YvlB
MLITGLASAQSPVPLPTDMDRRGTPDSELPDEARAAAEEYLEVLRQLQDKLLDYSEYIRELDEEEKDQLLAALYDFTKDLNSGEYSSSCNELVVDLSDLLKYLRSEERELKKVDKRKLRKLILGLRLELTALNQLLQEEVAKELQECAAHQEAMAAYLEAALSGVERGPRGTALPTVPDIDGVLPVPPVPDIRGIPSVPDIPVPQVKSGKAPEYGLQRTFSESVEVTGDKGPVVITTRAGDVFVTGGAGPLITARLDIVVSAATREKEKSFVDGVTLDVSGTGEEYTVSVRQPELSDPETRLLTSQLIVQVPSDLPVECINVSGNVVVSKIRSAVSIIGDHSTVTVAETRGELEVINTLGSVFLTSVRGDINVSNSYSSITVTNSTGSFDLNNQYGSVTVMSSSGELELVNSGTVVVRDYDGEVRIDNSSGSVQVSRVNGNVWAFNSYHPLMIAGVDGAVRLENANGPINIAGVTGRMAVANRFGSIEATNFAGPVRLVNENGSVTLVPQQQLQGRSVVTTSGGMISLKVDRNTDLQVDVETLEGSIMSSLPMEQKREGDLLIGSLKLGSGEGKLALSGTGSAIIIGETD